MLEQIANIFERKVLERTFIGKRESTYATMKIDFRRNGEGSLTISIPRIMPSFWDNLARIAPHHKYHKTNLKFMEHDSAYINVSEDGVFTVFASSDYPHYKIGTKMALIENLNITERLDILRNIYNTVIRPTAFTTLKRGGIDEMMDKYLKELSEYDFATGRFEFVHSPMLVGVTDESNKGGTEDALNDMNLRRRLFFPPSMS